MRDLLVIFTTVFLAELGDKTQLATVLFASERKMPALLVFCAAAGALVASTAVAVLAGEAGGKYLSAIPLKLIAGLGFIAIGAWTVAQHFRGT
jgi:putative Ca2+/H+ antiporter (TMEM165/GDT1 family)